MANQYTVWQRLAFHPDNLPADFAGIDAGGQIQRAREARLWTRRDLARRARVSTDSIYRLESGRGRIVGQKTIRRVAAALGLTWDGDKLWASEYTK